MIRLSQTSLFLLIGFLINTSGYSVEQIDVAISLDAVFVPKGFDSNDSVEIVAIGELPNTCFLRPRGEVKIVDRRAVIEMKATQIVDDQAVCIEAIVPYIVSISLGHQLQEGKYDILVNEGSTSEKTSSIFIELPNSNSINNFTYANVTSIDTLSEPRQLVISGFHPSSCMEIKRVEIFANESQDTYSVLPIIEQSQPICDRMIKPFTFTIQIPTSEKDRQLVHVRKLDGTALNYIVRASK